MKALLLAIAALATLAAFGGPKKSTTLSPALGGAGSTSGDSGPAPKASTADLELVANYVLTREEDAAIVLELGALFARNMLTVTMDGTGRYRVDDRPQYFSQGKLPLRDDLVLLPESLLHTGPQGQLYNVFQVRAFNLQKNMLTATGAGGAFDRSATMTLSQALAKGKAA